MGHLVTILDDPKKYVLSFDGVDDYVSAGLPSLGGVDLFADTGKAWTVVFTAKSPTGTIIGKGTGNFAARNFSVSFNSGVLTIVLRGATNTSATIAADILANFAVTWDGTTAKLYINGVYDKDLSVGTAVIQTNNINIGALGAGTLLLLTGMVRDVQIWDTARTAAQILDNIGKNINPLSSGLAAYWPMNEGYGAMCYDRSPNKNNAAITGASWVVRQ